MLRILFFLYRIFRFPLFWGGFVLAGASVSLTDCVRAQQVIDNVPLYYILGGGQVTSAPASFMSNANALSTSTALNGSVCGKFDPTVDIQSILSDQLGNVLTSLSAVPNTVASALPGSILCRAKPGMCQLLQHYVVRAENQWNLSVEACERSMQEFTAGSDPFHDLVKVSQVQSWRRQAMAGSSATEAKRKVDASDGCVEWIGGQPAGCAGKDPIWLIRDTAEAGWCLLLEQSSNCSISVDLTSGENLPRLRQIWPQPQAASKWITDVLGDYRVQSEARASTTTGSGVLPKVEKETARIKSQLETLVYSAQSVSGEDFKDLKANWIELSPPLIHALRDLHDRDYLIARIANEIALSRVIEKGFLARRVLLSGSMEPHVQSIGTASETLQHKIDNLEKDIQRAVFEFQITSRLVSDTTLQVLEAHAVMKTPNPAHKDRPRQLLE